VSTLQEQSQANLAAALWYADKYGWAMVPGVIDEFGRKRPWLTGWSENASTDPDEIRRWWSANAGSIVGLCCGMSNLIVVDIDIHDETKNGYESLHVMMNEIGRSQEWFDSLTVVSKSGGGGKHYIFKAPEGIDLTKRKISWRPGIDVLIGGSFVVLPPSQHPSGNNYAWEVSPEDREVGELPGELIQLLIRSTDAINPEERVNATRYAELLESGSSSGERNNDLIRLIGWLRRRIGDTPEAHAEIREKLEEWRDKCDPIYRGPAEDDEFERTWASGLRMEHAAWVDWYQDALATAGFEGETTRDLSLWMEPRIGAMIRTDTAGELFLWNGKKWIKDDEKHVQSYGMLDSRWSVIDAFQRDTDAAANQLEAAGQQRPATRLRAWSTKMRERAPMIDAMRMVTGRQEAVKDSEWDPDPSVLHCANGVLDLTNGTLMPHDPSRMNRALCPTPWNPTAKAPLAWLQLLDFMLPGEQDMQRYVCAALGFSLWGDNHQKSLFVLHGDANNGKSTLLQTFIRLVGIVEERKTTAYAGLVDKKVLAETKGDQHPAGVADAVLKRVGVLAGEWGVNDKLNLEVIKAITGDDMVNARFMREDFSAMRPKVTPWIATNHVVQMREFDTSIRARLKLINLHGVIPEDKRKPSYQIRAELEAEAEGFLRLCVDEMLKARSKGGLAAIEPQSMKDAIEESIDDQDLVLNWAHARLMDLRLEMPDAEPAELARTAGLSITELLDDFTWRHHHMNATAFSMRMTKIFKLTPKTDCPQVLRNGERARRYPLRWVTDQDS
jgi:putative DNA primase/helicase